MTRSNALKILSRRVDYWGFIFASTTITCPGQPLITMIAKIIYPLELKEIRHNIKVYEENMVKHFL